MTPIAWAAGAGARALVLVDERDAASGLVDPIDADSVRWIDGPDGHHLQRVRRLERDEGVVVADGAGLWYLGRIVETRPGGVRVERVGDLHLEPVLRPRLTVAFGPTRADHGVEVTRQLVELGADEIVPLLTLRGVVRWEADRGTKPVERLRRVVREAAMQCHRARVPTVGPPSEMARWHSHPGVLVGARDGRPIPEVVDPSVEEWVVLIGPEGGFAPDELAVVENFLPVAVGPTTLRALTATVAVTAALSPWRHE